MAIPRADRELLRAQSEGGRAGATKWQASQGASASSRNRVINRALQESAMRGVPMAARQQQGQQLRGAVGANRTAARLDEQSFQREMAGSETRWDNYNEAINAARTLIPDMARSATAPIRAAGRFELAGMRTENRGNIAEIEAQTRFQLAQMEAAAQAYERQLEEARRAAAASGGGGGAGGTLEEDELGALLAAQAQNILGGAIETTSEHVGTRRRQARGTFNVADARDSLNALLTAPPAVTPDEQAARDLRIQELRDQIETGAVRPSQAHRMMSRPRPSSFYTDYYDQPNEYYYDVPGPIANPDPSRVPPPVYGVDVPGPPTLLPAAGTGPDIYQTMAAQRAANMANQAQANRGEFGSYLREQFPQGFAMPTRGLTGQLEGVAPGASQLLGLVGEPAYRPRDIREALGGQFARGMGVPDPSAPQALDLATGLAAQRLRGRYDFTGPEYLAAAEGAFDPGATYYDMLAEQTGRPAPSEAYELAQKAAAARPSPMERRQAGIARRERREDEAYEDISQQHTLAGYGREAITAEQEQNELAQQGEDEVWAQDFYNKFQVPYTSAMGDINFVEQIVATADFATKLDEVKKLVFDEGAPIEDALNEAQIDNLGIRKLIAEMVSAS